MPVKKYALALVVLAGILFAGELACRIKYYRLHKQDLFYLVTPFVRVSQTDKAEHGLFLPDSVAERFGVALRDYPAWANTAYDRPCLDKMTFSECSNAYLPASYNSFCWRGGEVEVEKPAGTFRIIAVGGSALESDYIADQDLVTTRLENYLNGDSEAGRRFEVINAGHAAYDCYKIDQMLKTKAALFRPDMLLYTEAFNEQVEALAFFQVEEEMLQLADSPWIGWLHKRLYLRSLFYTYCTEKYYYRNRQDKIGYYNEQPSRECFVKMIEDCRASGVEFVYVTQPINFPLKDQDGTDFNDEKTLRRLVGEYYRKATDSPQDKSSREMVRALNQRLINRVQMDLCAEMDVPVINMLEVFDRARAGDTKLFTDIVHRTCQGEDLLAREIHEGLKLLFRQQTEGGQIEEEIILTVK